MVQISQRRKMKLDGHDFLLMLGFIFFGNWLRFVIVTNDSLRQKEKTVLIYITSFILIILFVYLLCYKNNYFF